MRLAKLAVASVSPTVGAVRSNVSRLIAVAKEMADANVTIGAFPEQAIGGYPPEDLVQWPGFLDRPAPRARALREGNRGSPTVFVLGLAVSVGGQTLQRRRGRASRPHRRPRAEGKAADLQRVLRRPHVLARRPGAGARRRRRAARRLSLPVRFRRRRGGSVRGRLVAGRADAPPLLLGLRNRRQRLELAVSHGHRLDAARNAGDARGRQPGGAALRERGRRPGRLDLRRRRLHLPERPAGVRSAAIRRRLVVVDRRSRSHAAAAHGEHDVAQRLRGVPPRARDRAGRSRSTGTTADRRSLTYPAPDGGSFFLPAARSAEQPTRAIARSTICSKRSRSA